MQEWQIALHPAVVHLRLEDRTARINHVVRVARMDFDMAVEVVVDLDIRFDCAA